MKEKGTVVDIENDEAIIEGEAQGACDSCENKDFCLVQGTGKVRIRARNDVRAEIGDVVNYETNPANFLLTAFIFYIVPIIFLMIGYFVFYYLFKTEIIGIGGAILFSGGSYLLIKKFEKKLLNRDFQPKIINIISKSSE